MSKAAVIGVGIVFVTGLAIGNAGDTEQLPAKTNIIRLPPKVEVITHEVKPDTVVIQLPEICKSILRDAQEATDFNYAAAKAASDIETRVESINLHRVTDPQLIVKDVQYLQTKNELLFSIATRQNELLIQGNDSLVTCEEEVAQDE